MKIIERRWTDVSRSDEFRLYPLADPHVGAAGCDEGRLRAVVKQIADDPNGYWVDIGDKCEFINLSDKRFDPRSLAPWLKAHHLGDVAKAQAERYLEIVRPIASKCLGMVEGNHEYAIRAKYERDIQLEIVSQVKEWAGMDAADSLDLGVTGWLMLKFSRASGTRRTTTIRINVHHGFVGGRLAGAKALNMQRWLWTHECDLALMGHSHNTETQIEAVERVRGSRVLIDIRKGAFCGAFLGKAMGVDSYVDRKGYFPSPLGNIVVVLRPGAVQQGDRVKLIT